MDVGQLLTVQLPTLLVVIIGVPAVLAGYIVGFEYVVRRLPDRAQPAARCAKAGPPKEINQCSKFLAQ